MDIRPCSADPDMWFGYADDDASDGAAKARVYEQSAARARTICLRRCPLAQQRQCARMAADGERSTASGPASSCPAASTASDTNWPTPTQYCAGSPTARSIRGSFPRVLSCYPAMRPPRFPPRPSCMSYSAGARLPENRGEHAVAAYGRDRRRAGRL